MTIKENSFKCSSRDQKFGTPPSASKGSSRIKPLPAPAPVPEVISYAKMASQIYKPSPSPASTKRQGSGFAPAVKTFSDAAARASTPYLSAAKKTTGSPSPAANAPVNQKSPGPMLAASLKGQGLTRTASAVAQAILNTPAPAPAPPPYLSAVIKKTTGLPSPAANAPVNQKSPGPMMAGSLKGQGLPGTAPAVALAILNTPSPAPAPAPVAPSSKSVEPSTLAPNPSIQKDGKPTLLEKKTEEDDDDDDDEKEDLVDDELSISRDAHVFEGKYQSKVNDLKNFKIDKSQAEDFYRDFFSQYERDLTRVLDMESLRLSQGYENINDMHYYELDYCYNLFYNAFYGETPMILGDDKLRNEPKPPFVQSEEDVRYKKYLAAYQVYCETIKNFGYLSKDNEHVFLPKDRYTVTFRSGQKICETPRNQGGILSTQNWTIAQNDSAILGIIRAYKSVHVKTDGLIPKSILWEDSPRDGSPSRPKMLGRELVLLIEYGRYTVTTNKTKKLGAKLGSICITLDPLRPASEEALDKLKEGPVGTSYTQALQIINTGFKDWEKFKEYLESKKILVDDTK